MLLKLILKNYLPLKSKGVNGVTLHTKSIFNIILGRNGYGKTSILRELSPLPPDNADYGENGYKEVEYNINGKHYLLISKTGKKSEHYFYLNGENLNPGMTLMVQRELVRVHFGITPDIKAIISGIDKGDVFTSLSPQRRKQVLMEINPNDTSYALKVYDKIRLNYNQTKGALKHQRQRLAAELKRQEDVKSTPIEELNYEIKFLDKQIKDALILHGSLQHVTDPDILALSSRMDQLMLNMLAGASSSHLAPSYYHEMIERTHGYIENDKVRQAGLEALITDITNKINNVNPSPDFSMQGYEERMASLQTQINELNEHKDKILEVISREGFFKLEDWTSEDFMSDIDGLIEHLSHIEVTHDKEITSQLFIELVEKQKVIETEIKVLEKDIDKARHQLEHYRQTDDVQCPKCDNKFKLGFEKFNPAQLEEFLAAAINTKTSKVEMLNGIKKRIEINEAWYYSMTSFMRFVKHSRVPRYIIEIMKYYDIGKVAHPKLINIFKMMKQYSEHVQEEAAKKTEQSTLEGYYRLMNEYDIKQLYVNLEELSIELGLVQKRLRRRLADVKAWNEALDDIKADELSRDVYGSLFEQMEELLVQKGEWFIKQAVETRVNDLTPRKEALVAKLIRSESLNSVVESIQTQVTELEKRERHLSFLMDSLSPTKGFIGHLMLDFLKSLCGNVNAVIEKVWTDPLRLQSPDIDEDNSDLDYKFKVITTDPKKPITDIKKCSGGEKDLIDFAIRYTLLRYLGIRSGLPLSMDEIGASFDELHRQKFSHYISTEARLDKLPQTFMISHYVSQYGIFKSDDVNIITLNMVGIKVPEKANANAMIS